MVRGIVVMLVAGSMALVQADQVLLDLVDVSPDTAGVFEWPNLEDSEGNNYDGEISAGEYQLSIDWDPGDGSDVTETVGGFCVQDVWAPSDYELYDLVKPSELGPEYKEAAWLFEQYAEIENPTVDQAAGTQVAIWEVVLDPGNYNIDDLGANGDFYVQAVPEPANLSYGAKTHANTLLSMGFFGSDYDTFSPDANYRVAQNPITVGGTDTQNYLIPYHSVPEPASISLLLLGLGLLGVSGYRRRSTRS